MHPLAISSARLMPIVGIVFGLTSVTVGIIAQRKKKAGLRPPYLAGWGTAVVIGIMIAGCLLVAMAS